jgi:F-type H+-transporting ATPase subunit epsilon
MSTKTLKLKIVTPERLILEDIVTQVSLPTTEGVITVLPGHVQLISSLGTGEIVVRHLPASVEGEESAESPMAVSGGFVEIKNAPHRPADTSPQKGEEITEVIILANTAEHVSQIDIERAMNRAKELMDMKNASDVDFEHFEAELERSLNRVKIADKWKGRKYRSLPFHL